MAGFSEGRTRPGGTGSLGTSGSLQFKQGGKFSGDNEITWDPTGDYLSVTGTISASYFYGDGSGLTGVGGSPGSPVNSVQFNEASSFGGEASFTWNKTGTYITPTLAVTGNTALSGGWLQQGGGQIPTFVPDSGLSGAVLLGYAGETGNPDSVYNLQIYSGEDELKAAQIYLGVPDGGYNESELGVSDIGPATITIGSSGSTITIDGGDVIANEDSQGINIGMNMANYGQVNIGSLTASTDGRVAGNWRVAGANGPVNATLYVGNAGDGEEERNPGYIVINDGNDLSSTGSATIYNTDPGGLFLSSSKELGVPGGISSSLNISASAFYGDGSSLTGISSGQSYDTITATTKTAAIDTTYYVTPNASNTTVTLPAAGTAGSTIKFIFDSLTGVDRYCDIGVTSAAAFKTPFSSGATNMRLWKPCDVTFLDNGTEWTAMEGSCYEIQTWFLNETVGSLGHGLVEAVPFGQMSGFGCTGLLMGTGWQQREKASLTMTTTNFYNESLLDSDNNPLYFGKTYRRGAINLGLFCESREDLVLTGSVQQFFVFVGYTGPTFVADDTYHRYLGNSDGSTVWSFNMLKIGSTTDAVLMGIKDSSGNESSFTSNTYGNDTLFQFAWGLDTVSPWYSESGSAPAAMPDNNGSDATDFADVDNPIGCMIAKNLSDWEVGPTRACGAWFYHGRARWSSAEAADFWEIRTSGSAKVFL